MQSSSSWRQSAEFEPLRFLGNSNEYFKIWIVNIALTLLTLGIYSAWAKVRSNRYLFASTYLHNANFEYNAKPQRILLGRIIVFLFYGLFLLFSDYLAMYTIAGAILIVFLLMLPWLMRQAISFKLKNTSYRNIPFGFRAKRGSFYKLILKGLFSVAALIIPLALIHTHMPSAIVLLSPAFYLLLFLVIAPLLYRSYKELLINNALYGESSFLFTASRAETIALFFKMGLLIFALLLVLATITSIIALYFFNLNGVDPKVLIQTSNQLLSFGLLFLATLLYLVVIGFFKGVVDSFLSNFTRNHTQIDGCQFKGTMHPLKLGFISATNAAALLLSLGLLYPWSKIRYLRYKIENTHFACDDYEKFSSLGYEKPSPFGEEALDFFDIDIGL